MFSSVISRRKPEVRMEKAKIITGGDIGQVKGLNKIK
jgi:hypothetical protein